MRTLAGFCALLLIGWVVTARLYGVEREEHSDLKIRYENLEAAFELQEQTLFLALDVILASSDVEDSLEVVIADLAMSSAMTKWLPKGDGTFEAEAEAWRAGWVAGQYYAKNPIDDTWR